MKSNKAGKSGASGKSKKRTTPAQRSKQGASKAPATARAQPAAKKRRAVRAAVSKKPVAKFSTRHADAYVVEQKQARAAAEGRTRIETWWPNGRPRTSVECLNGVPDGRFESWFPDGRPAAVGAFVAGAPAGAWTGFHRSGKKAWTGRYRHGAPSGSWSLMGAKGERLGGWRADLEDHPYPSMEYWANGLPKSLSHEQTLGESVVEAEWTDFGALAEAFIYDEDNERAVYTWHPNGALKERRTERWNPDWDAWRPDGTSYTWHANGRLAEQADHDSWRGPRGAEERWYASGQRKMLGHYSDAGERTGLWRWWDRSGRVVREGAFARDRESGTWSAPGADGKPVETEYVDGRKLAPGKAPPPFCLKARQYDIPASGVARAQFLEALRDCIEEEIVYSVDLQELSDELQSEIDSPGQASMGYAGRETFLDDGDLPPDLAENLSIAIVDAAGTRIVAVLLAGANKDFCEEVRAVGARVLSVIEDGPSLRWQFPPAPRRRGPRS